MDRGTHHLTFPFRIAAQILAAGSRDECWRFPIESISNNHQLIRIWHARSRPPHLGSVSPRGYLSFKTIGWIIWDLHYNCILILSFKLYMSATSLIFQPLYRYYHSYNFLFYNFSFKIVYHLNITEII